MFTEGEDWPRTTDPLHGGGTDEGVPELALLRFDPGTGEVTRLPLEWEWPFADGALLSWAELECDADGACAARIADGDGAEADAVLDADTGAVLAEDPPGADLPGVPTPDGRLQLVSGVDGPDDGTRLPWVQYRTPDGRAAGPRVPTSQVSAVTVDRHPLSDGTALLVVQEDGSNAARLLSVAPGDTAATVLAETAGVPPRDPLAVDEAGGRAHLVGALDVLVPVLVSVDLATGEVTQTGPLCPEDATVDHLLLTAAGAVTVGSCEGRAEGLWVLR